MIQEITRAQAANIKNPVFRYYANMYLDIYDDFIKAVESLGLPFDKAEEQAEETYRLIAELKKLGILSRCEDASLVYNRLSPACEACKKGIGTATTYLSFACHRHCFFCFNPNQDNYEDHISRKNDWRAELEQIKRSGKELSCLALTGGEPLLYPEDCVAFFLEAKELFPKAHKRLYTSGDLLTEELLGRLGQAGLNEIRFSCKLEDEEALKEQVLERIGRARAYIGQVMVEMPVMPDREEEMRGLLKRLDDMGIFGINLLELCFPFANVEAFAKRGYRLKYPPYRTLYNFDYAGGLPVAGSERTALRLLAYAAGEKMKLGVHYCSLENKHFGQLYQQNRVLARGGSTMYFSEKDHYLKTVKAFGNDALRVLEVFRRAGIRNYIYDREGQFIQFHPQDARLLKNCPAELALSVNVMEKRDGEVVARELKLQLIQAQDCSAKI